METITPRTLAPIFARGERRRQYLKLPPRSVDGDDLAREPGPFIIFGRARPRQREDRPSFKLVEGLARRAFRLSLGMLLEGLADAGEGDGGHCLAGARGVQILLASRGDPSRDQISRALVLLSSLGLSGANR